MHLSVQSNTVNWAAVKFWQSMGLSRVILSRELSLEEIEEIRQQCPDMELRSSSMARCASPIPAAACSPVTSTTATRTRAPAPTAVAGTTRCSPQARCRRRCLADRGEGAPRRADADRGGRARHLHHELEGPARHRARAEARGDGHRPAEDRGAYEIALLRGADLPVLPAGDR